MGSKSVKVEDENQDRISDLPDCLIHHILSFLPSTKEAIQTGIQSKRWQNQWTRVPVLIFHYTGISCENSLKIIANTLNLHDGSKIKKFHLYHPCSHDKDPQIDAKIHFETRKYVEDLSLTSVGLYTLPEFLFYNASLVKLTTRNCTFMPNGMVNWECLTELAMVSCKLHDQAMEHILSGSPLLKSLQLIDILSKFDKLIIVSKSLKRFCCCQKPLHSCCFVSDFEISCPNLEELSLNLDIVTTCDSKLVTRVIENFVSGSLLLKSFELINFDGISRLVIVSESLKRLVIGHFSDVVISCPKLEKLSILSNLGRVRTAKLLNPSSLLCATLDFYGPEFYRLEEWEEDEISDHKGWIKDILQQLQDIEELKLGSSFIKVLSNLASMGDLFLRVLNVKCLTLDYPNSMNPKFGIACVLQSSHMLEKLVINVPHYNREYYKYYLKLNDFGEDYWSLNDTAFDCLLSHLKIIKIIGRPDKVVLCFVKFLLKNARMLEKMLVKFEFSLTTVHLQVFEQKLMSLPRCSENVVIELLLPNQIRKIL